MSALAMDQLQPNINGVKDSIAWYQLQAQLETNRLLEILINGNKQETETIKVIDYSNMKRPELMRNIGKTKAPQGWQKWSNEKMLEYLKGE